MSLVIDPSLLWAGVIAFGIVLYVVLDGFDLGVGILFPWARGETRRDLMMNAVAPVWDGNETWLVMGGAALFAAFPAAYAVLLPAFYLPLMVMLIALVLRGVSFEFRFRAHGRGKSVWGATFALGSALAAFAQGVVLGAFIQGVDMERSAAGGAAFSGGLFDWFTLFSAATGVALVFGYTLLGACWLIIKTSGALQDWCRAIARRTAVVVLCFIALVSIMTPYIEPEIAARWFTLPGFYTLLPVPVLTAALGAGLWWSLRGEREILPFLFSIGLFLLCFAGLAISLFPYIVPRQLTIWQAAAAPESQLFLLAGVAVLIPIIVLYTAYAYSVFRGKVRADEGYH